MITMNKAIPLTLKPDWPDAAARWNAYWEGEMLDRPLLWITAPVSDFEYLPVHGYRERLFGDLDAVVEKTLHNQGGTIWGGESFPQFWTSFGPDELGVFCGAEFQFGPEFAGDTNWATHIVEDWEEFLPFHLPDDNPTWLRMQELYRKAEPKCAGRALLFSIDSHSNMDLLMSLRGSEQLCLDMMMTPELIDRAMLDAREVFKKAYARLRELARWDIHGYSYDCYAPDGCSLLACDFSALMSPPQFRRWAMPALEEEAEIVKRVMYHWDGPAALVHANSLFSIPRLHTFAYVPDPGVRHIEHLDLFKRVQAAGKAVSVNGSPDEIKAMHKELDPARVIYRTGVRDEKEMEELIAWFVRNT
jgi:hypothetical protein